MYEKRPFSRQSPDMDVRSAKTAASLSGHRVGYSNVGKTSVPDAGRKNATMSGLARRATETSQTAFGQIRSSAAPQTAGKQTFRKSAKGEKRSLVLHPEADVPR
jgi:molybdopterin-guanine dinucleotide biosynthesis protein